MYASQYSYIKRLMQFISEVIFIKKEA